MTNLSRPCALCPFARGSTFEESMSRGRAQEIADSLEGAIFPCHKTTTTGGASGTDEKCCVGALGTLENDGELMQNQMVRICARLGMIDDPAGADYLVECYGSLQEWVDAHD